MNQKEKGNLNQPRTARNHDCKKDSYAETVFLELDMASILFTVATWAWHMGRGMRLHRPEWKRRLATGGAGGDMEGAHGRESDCAGSRYASIGLPAVIRTARGGAAVDAADPPP